MLSPEQRLMDVSIVLFTIATDTTTPETLSESMSGWGSTQAW